MLVLSALLIFTPALYALRCVNAPLLTFNVEDSNLGLTGIGCVYSAFEANNQTLVTMYIEAKGSTGNFRLLGYMIGATGTNKFAGYATSPYAGNDLKFSGQVAITGKIDTLNTTIVLNMLSPKAQIVLKKTDGEVNWTPLPRAEYCGGSVPYYMSYPKFYWCIVTDAAGGKGNVKAFSVTSLPPGEFWQLGTVNSVLGIANSDRKWGSEYGQANNYKKEYNKITFDDSKKVLTVLGMDKNTTSNAAITDPIPAK